MTPAHAKWQAPRDIGRTLTETDLMGNARAARKGRSILRRFWKRLWLVPVLFLVVLALGFGTAVHHVYFDRDNLPSLEPFIRFELPTTGRIYDANGDVLFELAREYRRILKCEEIPPVVRDAILSAEDKNFFSHSGVDYSVFPRV